MKKIGIIICDRYHTYAGGRCLRALRNRDGAFARSEGEEVELVGWCGEVMEMYLRLDGNRITDASFWADGCLSTMACGDMLTALVQGRTVTEAAAITPEELIAARVRQAQV